MSLRPFRVVLVMLSLWLPAKAEQKQPSEQSPLQSKPAPKEDCCVLELTSPAGLASGEKARKPTPLRHVEGNAASRIRVIIYEDLQCPDCAVFRKALDETLLPRYGAVVAFEHRDFPIPKHSWATEAAVAARYLHDLDPGTAAEFRRRVQGRISEINARGFRAELSAFCRDKRLDSEKALAALMNDSYIRAVDAEFQEGVAAGIRRTPTVEVAGKTFVETIDVNELQKALDALVGQHHESHHSKWN